MIRRKALMTFVVYVILAVIALGIAAINALTLNLNRRTVMLNEIG